MSSKLATPPQTLGLVLYPEFTALDLVGPLEVFARSPTRCLLVAKNLVPVTADRGLRVLPDTTFETCPPLDALLVSGGPGQSAAMKDPELISFLAHRHAQVRWTTSVCTGALLLAGAGLLTGKRATTHWLAMEELERLGAIPCAERIVEDGQLVTAAGVSAGIDLALRLVARWHGEDTARGIQLLIEYDPQPPFDSGSPARAAPHLIAELKAQSRFYGKRPKDSEAR